MNGVWVTLDDDLKGIPPASSGFCGYVYAIEFGDKLKIGQTQDPEARLRSLISYAKNYCDLTRGTILISPAHTNYAANERLIHHHFKSSRLSGELFSLSALEFLGNLPSLKFLDETERLRAKCDETAEFFKTLILHEGCSGPLRVVDGGRQGESEDGEMELLLYVIRRVVEHGKRIRALEQEVATLKKLVGEERRTECETCKWSKASSSGR